MLHLWFDFKTKDEDRDFSNEYPAKRNIGTWIPMFL